MMYGTRYLSLSFSSCALALSLAAGGCTGDEPVVFAPGLPPGTPEAEQQLEVARIEGEKVMKARFVRDERLDAFETRRARVDELGIAHVRTQQLYKGVRVWGGEAIVHLDPDGTVRDVTDSIERTVFVSSVQPKLKAEQAIARAIELDGCNACLGARNPAELPEGDDGALPVRNGPSRDWGCPCLTADPDADLWIMPEATAGRLVWRVRLEREEANDKAAFPVLFIDANTGALAWKYDNLQSQTADDVSLYSGTVSVVATLNGSYYNLEDRSASRKTGTYDMRTKTALYYKFLDKDNQWGVSGTVKGETSYTSQRAGVDAHWGADKVLAYYSSQHGRSGLDGSGGPFYSGTGLITSFVHYGRNYANAYWSGSYMVYGDGDGTNLKPLVALDICGHEMTHGVTQFEANLTYSSESGALNESMSDVFGELIELYAKGSNPDWRVGGQIMVSTATGQNAIRYMLNPHEKYRSSNYTADDDPDHYSERYTGTSDNGGVHINSGIGNKAFTLVAVGGTHHLSPGTTFTGIGTDKAGKIWYKALADYMTASTNFAGARVATLKAAEVLYPDVTNADGSTSDSPEYTAVAGAWTAVGVN